MYSFLELLKMRRNALHEAKKLLAKIETSLENTDKHNKQWYLCMHVFFNDNPPIEEYKYINQFMVDQRIHRTWMFADLDNYLDQIKIIDSMLGWE